MAEQSRRSGFAVLLLLLAAILGFCFLYAVLPGHILSSNDAPLGRVMSASHRLPARFTGAWQDLNSVGVREPAAMPSISYALLYLLKPVGFAKFYAPLALLMLGCAAWLFFRQLRLSAAACVLGGLAASLNSDFFSTACWGVAGHVIAVALTFLALTALVNDSRPWPWLRVLVAGLCVGMAVTEAADVGAILSLLVAAFVFWQAYMSEGGRLKNFAVGFCRLALIATCAGLVSAQALTELLSTNVVGMAAARTASQGTGSQWDWATQWSLPKEETLSFIVPGLFGFRTDTMNGGAYWGAIGRDPLWDDYEKNGQQGPAPTGFQRYTGGGIYAGVLVVLLAAWAAVQSWRSKNSAFNPRERAWLWFWTGVGGVSLLLAYGRHAPLYRLFYDLPHFSLIRNPVKFTHVSSIVLVVLFAYGIDSIWRNYLSRIQAPVVAGNGPGGSTAGLAFERNWVRVCVILFVFSLFAWFLYGSFREKLEDHLTAVGFSADQIPAMVSFSVFQVGWFILFFALASGVIWAVLSGFFARKWAVQGTVILGLVLVADLARANQPWIVVWDYQHSYTSNPIVDQLRDRPYEHRVALLPLQTPQKYEMFERLYKIVWMQNLFPAFNIQSLNIVQMSRMPDELIAYDAAFKSVVPADFARVVRRLQLTDTRYLLGPAEGENFLRNNKMPGSDQIHVIERFNLVPMPGVSGQIEIGELTAAPATNGDYALFEVSGALPRAKLYTHWDIETNSAAALERLTEPSFDPAETVLVSAGVGPAPSTTNQPAGPVDFTSYSPRDIVLKCNAPAAAVLLLNDRFDPNWKVFVDGRPETVLHCNYLMRGVRLDAGAHTVEFKFTPPTNALYVSVAAIVGGLVCVGLTLFTGRRAETVISGATARHPVPGAPAKSPEPKSPPQPAVSRSEKRRATRSKR